MQLIKDNAMILSAGTVGAAVIFAAAEWRSQGSAHNNQKVLISAGIGAAAGFLGSLAAVQANQWSNLSGGANWAALGASTAGALAIVALTYKRATTKQLIKNTVMWMTAAGLGGAAVTYAKQLR